MIKILCLNIFLFFFISSCSYEKTKFEISSIFEPTWDFSKTSEITFDKNFVEVKDGKVQLKALDLKRDGDDFDGSRSRGLYVNNNNLVSILDSKNSSRLDLRNILTSRSTHLTGYWKMEGNVLNEVTSNHGQLISSPFNVVDSKVGNYSLQFDGVDDAVILLDEENISPGAEDFTLAMWFKSAVDNNWLYHNYGTNLANAFGIGINGGNVQAIARDVVSNSVTPLTSGYDYNDNEWHHVAFVRKGDLFELYLDGALADSEVNALVGSVDVNGGVPPNFGRISHFNTNYFTGNLDEAGFWKYGLSSKEIATIFENQSLNFISLSPTWTPKWDNIVGYWKMDGNWQDSSGNKRHGAANGSPLFSSTAKVGDWAVGFPANSNLETDNTESVDFTMGLSFSLWIYLEDYFSGYAVQPFNKYNTTADSPFSLYLFGDVNSTASPCPSCRGDLAVIGNSSGSWGVLSGLHQDLPLNQWHHIGFVYSVDLGGQLYVNGKKSGAKYGSGALATNTEKIKFINNTGGGPSGVIIDETSIWNISLDDEEMYLIYNRQKQKYAGHYDSEVIDLGSVTSAWPDLSWSTNLPFGKALIGDSEISGNLQGESLSDYANLSSSFNLGLVANWSFEQISATAGSYNDFMDNSGAGNSLEASLTGIGFESIGVIGKGVALDGVSNRIFADDTNSLDVSEITISIWALTTIDNPFNGYLLDKIYLYTNATDGYGLAVRGNSTPSGTSSVIRFELGTGANHIISSPNLNIKSGVWNHYVASYSRATGSKLYLNGIQIYSDQIDRGEILGNNRILDLGRRSGSTLGYWQGNFDEAAIWNRSLNNTEVQELYRRGANRIKFQVRSCVDSTCECKSFNVSPQGNANDCDGDTIVNALDFDDPHKAKFIGPGGDGTTYYSELFNRNSTNLNFNCGLNTSDSNGNICVNDEISLEGGPKPTRPIIDYTNFPLSAKPLNNRYFQYRAYLEADENLACNGSPCLPELTSVDLNPSGLERYFGAVQEVKPVKAFAYNSIQSIEINADDCVTYQLSPDGINYFYVSSGAWVAVSEASHRSTRLDLENHIVQFSNDRGPGFLHIKAFLQTNTNQTSSCSLRTIEVISVKK